MLSARLTGRVPALEHPKRRTIPKRHAPDKRIANHGSFRPSRPTLDRMHGEVVELYHAARGAGRTRFGCEGRRLASDTLDFRFPP
jgi:hypothetical protein